MNDRLKDHKHIKWAKLVKEHDNYKCIVCGNGNTYLHSHHLNSYDMFVNDRYNVSNGATLCVNCHSAFHRIYGRGNNTKYQFEQFAEMMKFIINIAKKSCREAKERNIQ
jgi:5-methylcytosine-specific restriction endonuclease McrA